MVRFLLFMPFRRPIRRAVVAPFFDLGDSDNTMADSDIARFSSLSVAQKYIVLALAADALIEQRAVVFHYFGPNHLKNIAQTITAKGKTWIVEKLKELESDFPAEIIDSPPIYRRSYLLSQIRSLRGFLEYDNVALVGKDLADAVEVVLGISPPQKYDLETIKAENQAVFSQHGRCYNDFVREHRSNRYRPISAREINQLIEQLKTHCAADIVPRLYLGDSMQEVLAQSKVSSTSPKNGYPPCYYIYRGKGRGTVFLSDGHRRDKVSALRSLLHELYPGHHFYYLYRELLLKLGYLGDEATIDLLYGAETPVNEGIAESALLFLNSLDPELRQEVEIGNSANIFYKKLLYNVWYGLYLSQDMNKADAVKYLQAQGDTSEEALEMWLNFIDEWRLYYPAYPVGTALVREYIAKNEVEGLRNLYLPKPLSVVQKLAL